MNAAINTLILKEISKSFQSGSGAIQALSNVSLEIEPGEFVGLSGPSGSGKSTLLNICGLTESPDEGEVFIEGVKANFEREPELVAFRRTRLGFIFQYFNLLSSLTAAENVAFSLLLNRVPHHKAIVEATKLLERVGLGERRDHFPNQLSGGEMQRVSLCRAIIHKPVLVLADEPTGNLDSTTGGQVLDLLQELSRQGISILMASHSAQALKYCDRILLLNDGCLKAAP